MGFLDHLKDKADELGEKVKGGSSARTDAEPSAVETPADEVGDVGHAPAAEPLDPALETVDPVLEPTALPAHEEDPSELPPDRTA